MILTIIYKAARLSIILLMTSAYSVQAATMHQAERSTRAALAKNAADARAERVSAVAYHLFFNLTEKSEKFSGRATVGFDLSKTDEDLTLDFAEGQVLTLEVNGAATAIDYNGFNINIPAKALRPGRNEVKIGFTHAYSTSGNGFYRFEDPVDKRVYTYTDFEPFHANYLFPAFDQPNLKAKFTLSVDVPAKWVVVSATREQRVEKLRSGAQRWHFPESLPFSTYVFPLHAGEYKVWQDRAGKIPLRLFARQSMAKYVDHKEWFKVTKQGFDFFQKYFAYPYPFGKYDQLVVPDFNWGAMENIGAVTFSEKFAPRGVPTSRQRENRAGTILHEMAHMWFGNLVTMSWWDDLWLNESFATYMATLAQAEATEFKRAWQTFFSSTKQWAYWEDQLVTNHPITTDVPDTEQAFTNFDGITYGKGASTLKQLAFLLGPEKFRDGVRRYIKKHEFKNTTLADFMGALAQAAGTDLQPFSKEWLALKGVNSIEAVYECSDGKVSSFALRQTAPPTAPTLRTHRTNVALYYSGAGGKVKQGKVAAVTYSGGKPVPVPALVGENCPLMVNANEDDYDFVKIKLDARTLQTAKTSLAVIEDPLDRQMIWQSLWEMVRDGELDVYTYNTLLKDNLTKETDIQVLEAVSKTLLQANKASVMGYLPDKGQEAENARKEFFTTWENLTYSKLLKAKAGSDEQKLWYDSYVTVAQSKQGLEAMVGILQGKVKFPKFTIDQDRRWQLVATLNAFAHPQAEALLAAEEKRDSSHRGKLGALAARAGRPGFEQKKAWFDKLLGSKDLKLAEKKAIMSGLFPHNQDQERAKFEDLFFNSLPQMVGKEDEHMLESFTEALVPALCSRASSNKLGKFIQHNGSLPPYVLKPLKVNHQEDERCLEVRRIALEALKSSAS